MLLNILNKNLKIMFKNYNKFELGWIYFNLNKGFKENVKIFASNNRTEIGWINRYAYNTIIKANYEKLLFEGLVTVFMLLIGIFIVDIFIFKEKPFLLSFEYIWWIFAYIQASIKVFPFIQWIIYTGVLLILIPIFRYTWVSIPFNITNKNLKEFEKKLKNANEYNSLRCNIDILKSSNWEDNKTEKLRKEILKKYISKLSLIKQ